VFTGMGSMGGTVSDTMNACSENFWSAACWFTPGGAVSGGFENPAGTISVTPPPVANCAGTLNPDGTCTPYAQPNDADDSTDTLNATGGNFQSIWQTWVNGVINSANVPGNNTAGTGYIWVAVGIGALVLLTMKGK
jgi:hypothetical protein